MIYLQDFFLIFLLLVDPTFITNNLKSAKNFNFSNLIFFIMPSLTYVHWIIFESSYTKIIEITIKEEG